MKFDVLKFYVVLHIDSEAGILPILSLDLPIKLFQLKKSVCYCTFQLLPYDYKKFRLGELGVGSNPCRLVIIGTIMSHLGNDGLTRADSRLAKRG